MEDQVPTRPVNGNRYQLETRADSPRQTPTPPKSPMKTLPTAPDPATRVATSQKYIKTSVARSPLASPYLNQHSMNYDKPATRDEAAHRAKSPNQIAPSRSPEPTRPIRDQKPSLTKKISQTFRQRKSPDNPEPKGSQFGSDAAGRVKSPEPGRYARSPQPMRSAMSPEPLRATKNQHSSITRDSPEPVRAVHGPSPALGDYQIEKPSVPVDRTRGSGSTISEGTATQAVAHVNGKPKPPTPERAPSRRRSLTERTRDLIRKKPSFTREIEEDAQSGAYLPIQSHSVNTTPAKRPASPVTTTIARRTSSRGAKALSMSTYSTSPTSPTNLSSESTPIREASPVLLRNGKPVPSQSSYGILTLEPVRPMSPLEHPAMTLDAAKQQKSDPPVKSIVPPTIKSANDPVDTEGNVNTNHPLLQTARHARFARNSNGDLPLRHYHSQGALTHSNPDLTQRPSGEKRPPKRSSSLLYNPNTRFMSSPEPNRSRSTTPTQGLQSSKRSPTPNQQSQNPATTTHITHEVSAPTGSELGIHPAHRTLDPASASTALSSPLSTGSSLTEHGATPPPIATTREFEQATLRAKSPTMSPPTRFAPFPPSQPPKQPQVTTEAVSEHDWQPQHQPQRSTDSSSNPLASTDPKFKTSATSNTPFYLNPASSTALIDFLATTPPPSPPHPGIKLNRDLTPSPAPTSSASAFFNRPFLPNNYNDGEASPPPPAPGSRSMTHLGRINSGEIDREKAKKGWKKMFGVGKSGKKKNMLNGGKPVNGKKKKVDLSKVGDISNDMIDGMDGGPGEGNPLGMQSDGGFVGMGPDGNWISRKNFMKT